MSSSFMDKIKRTIECEIMEVGTRIECAAAWIFGDEDTDGEIKAYREKFERKLIDVPNKTYWLKSEHALECADEAKTNGDLCRAIQLLNEATYFLGCAEHFQQNTDDAKAKQSKKTDNDKALRQECRQWIALNGYGDSPRWHKAEKVAKYLGEKGIKRSARSLERWF